MRKSIFIALVSLFLAVLLISCDSKNQDDPTPSQPNQSGQTDKSSLPRLSVLVDLPSAGSGSVDDFFSYVPGNGKSFLIITETLPPEGQERSAALTRIRTEILAGKGPDVFICTCWVPGFGEEGLFKFPNQAMENRIFLPLDDYISGAESTIEANKRFFEKEEDVPRQAYTMGIGNIMRAKKILIIVSGAGKADIVAKAFTGPVTSEVPASILQFHSDVTLVGDEAALGKLMELV